MGTRYAVWDGGVYPVAKHLIPRRQVEIQRQVFDKNFQFFQISSLVMVAQNLGLKQMFQKLGQMCFLWLMKLHCPHPAKEQNGV